MSAYIVTRAGKTGNSYVVRYRRGGRGFRAEHAGSFKTLKEARTRRDLVAGELAAGRDPKLILVVERAATVAAETFREVAARWLASRVDVKASTYRIMEGRNNVLDGPFGAKVPAAITTQEIVDWVADASARLAGGSVRNLFHQLRGILDHAELTRNPARSEMIRLPRDARKIPTPPTATHVEALNRFMPAKYRLVVTVLEQTGCRIGELEHLDWSDVDITSSRFRVTDGKTAAARRWVVVPDFVMDKLLEKAPYDDRAGRVFPSLRGQNVRVAMRRACQLAGVPHYHPHDLRHRYVSVQLARGVPVANVAAQVGHAKQSMTHDVYSHVLLAEDDS